jgi:hypothetical protein
MGPISDVAEVIPVHEKPTYGPCEVAFAL